nr:hypothetical protein [uncultured Oscillibacter sp.]
MRGSYEGIGRWAATFACGKVEEGQVVKVSGGGKVSACAAGEAFCGQVLSVGRDGGACAVALGGLATAAWSGDAAPTVGWCGLAADGAGGVQAAAAGRSYLVVDVDETAGTVTFVL